VSKPCNVRNFWVECEPTDGTRRKKIGTGPVAKDGGLDITIYQRANGEVTSACSILGRSMADGSLVLTITTPNGELRHITIR
jgi:hypothetical protein